MTENTGQMIVESVNYKNSERFVVWLVSFSKGRVLESSGALEEPELRKLLHEDYGETDNVISMRIALAREKAANES